VTSGLVAHGEPPDYFTFASLTRLGLPHATTTRHCPGVASFAEPISPRAPVSSFRAEAVTRLAGAGLDMARVAYAKQVHGADVARAPAGGGFAGTVDGLVTAERGVPLAIFTADCLAIVLYDAALPALGAVHVGWRGTVKGAVQATVRALEGLGAAPSRLHAAIAPAIGPCCYEVDEPVIGPLSAAYAGWEAWARPAKPGRWMLDLGAANEALLRGAGLDGARIENVRLCTACNPGLLYSYRKGNRGRLATVAALP
jgi:YfiH family protein